ncbi:uncharacterized protein BDR25DRAFT_363713 [Lindgomyces ingoldianus]|uniref:Uncharacterized protein n=1 Tax=Lindgomyces ingoldianus TaxID=673940 RepID=A0ACB6Q811_9PLEO|nr:uncharacterized protein BDR25DRAFT_363713 [Lindgomyces ingoldianus]KAF2462655.1 hypothetical protein BDR25DRAFT_363713 [Lindgomyces ingoldianus]
MLIYKAQVIRPPNRSGEAILALESYYVRLEALASAWALIGRHFGKKLDPLSVSNKRKVRMDHQDESFRKGGAHKLCLIFKHAERVRKGVESQPDEWAKLRNAPPCRPDGHEVKWVVWVTKVEILGLDCLLKKIRLPTFRIIKVEHGVTKEVPKLTTHNGEKRVSRLPLQLWQLLHILSEV